MSSHRTRIPVCVGSEPDLKPKRDGSGRNLFGPRAQDYDFRESSVLGRQGF